MLKNLDSLLFYVTSVETTVTFYVQLGFTLVKKEKGMGVVKLGSFELHFHDKNEEEKPKFRDEALAEPKGKGLYVYIETESIDRYYESLTNKGIKPATYPRDWPWGNREFVVKDPDGYKLVFYQPL